MNDDEQVGSVNWSWFCILAGTMVLVGVATYFLLPSLISKTETNVTIVKAVKGPFKVKPTDPGGKIVGHQNLLVVDILKGGTREGGQTETLRPSSPSPEPPPVKVVMDATPAPTTPDDTEKGTTTTFAAQNAGAATVTKGLDAEKSNNKQAAKGPKKNLEISMSAASEKNNAGKKAAAKEGRSIKELSSKTKKRVIVIEGSAPLYMIQLAAFRSAKKAAEMAKILSQKHKSRIKDVNLETMMVDTGSNGIFHRIVSVPLPREDADKMCGILRRSGQDCFLRKYEASTP